MLKRLQQPIESTAVSNRRCLLVAKRGGQQACEGMAAGNALGRLQMHHPLDCKLPRQTGAGQSPARIRLVAGEGSLRKTDRPARVSDKPILDQANRGVEAFSVGHRCCPLKSIVQARSWGSLTNRRPPCRSSPKTLAE